MGRNYEKRKEGSVEARFKALRRNKIRLAAQRQRYTSAIRFELVPLAVFAHFNKMARAYAICVGPRRIDRGGQRCAERVLETF